MIKLIAITAALLSCTQGNTTKTDAGYDKSYANTSDMVKTNEMTSIHTFKVEALDGTTINFADFKGKKILIVNTASECGYTPQYKELEALYQKFKDKLVIVGFPANNFGGQEPGTNTEIKAFCQQNYGVTFPMAAKISVKGDDAAPIYQWLCTKTENGVLDAEIKWNFNKFLLDENGNMIAYFPSKVTPMSEQITGKL
jgi:glutathione peroxidase